MQEVRAAVIGTGVMGRKYAQMIAEGKAGALRLTAVVCRSAGAQQWAKDTLPDTVRVCPSADQLYDYAEEFDAVLVVTPHKTHPALVMQAFAHGKHVLCDKPSANALAPALEMNRAAEKSSLVFAMMFHQRRYKKYMRLKKLLDDGALGEIKRVQLEREARGGAAENQPLLPHMDVPPLRQLAFQLGRRGRRRTAQSGPAHSGHLAVAVRDANQYLCRDTLREV